MPWSVREVLELAPDGRSADAARRLAGSPVWSDLGSTDALVWGRCQGSGRTPYQVSVDLLGPDFTCTCPSRKQPCKHGVALMLLWAEGRGSVAHRAEPAAWAAPPRRRSEASSGSGAGTGSGTGAGSGTEDDAQGPKPPDPEARAKREQQRIATMSSGIDDFERWLYDLVRQGLADARRRPYSFWDTAAARLVDAQLPGLAQRVRDMAGLLLQQQDWADAAVAEVGRWFLVVRAWRNRSRLTGDQLGDLRTVIGWHRRTDEIRPANPNGNPGGTAPEDAAKRTRRDHWAVVGVRHEDDGALQSQRTWLYGRDGAELVVVLDFAAAGGPTLRSPQTLGSVVAATVALYPGTPPRRALFCDEPAAVGRTAHLPLGGSVAAALDSVADQLAHAPLRGRFPVGLRGVTPTLVGDRVSLVDPDRHVLPLAGHVEPWTLLAISAGRPVDVFGEFANGRFTPVSAATPEGLVTL